MNVKVTSQVLLLFGMTLGPGRVFSQEAATLTHASDMDSVYASVLNQVKRQGLQVESASKDSGIKTGLTVTGHYKQTGTHYELTFISNGPTETTVNVTAYEQHRYKALSVDPWSTPKVNQALSRSEAETLKTGLGW